MSDFTVEVGEIRTHEGKLRNLGDEVDTIADNLSGTGVGDYLMYGVLVGAIAYPALSLVAEHKSKVLKELSEVLHGEADQLAGTCQAYENVEQINVAGGNYINSDS